MVSNSAIPPAISKVSAEITFDGGVHISWATTKQRIIIALKSQGLVGYIDGSIPKPTNTPSITITSFTGTTTTSPDKGTPIYSTTPSLDEWVFRNDHTKGIIESYINDLPSLIADVDSKTAQELFQSLNNE